MRTQKGYLILEALIAIVIFGMLVVAIFPSLNFLVVRSRRTKENSQASVLLQEGMEATYNVLTQSSDPDLSGFADGKYILSAGTQWELGYANPQDIPQAIDIYERTIEINSVCRDGNGEQTNCSSGTPDQMSKKVTVAVSWTENQPPLEAEMVVVKF